MNLSHRDGELKEVFDDLEDAFTKIGVDFYLIGALARDTWYAKQDKNFRTTKDADFAILVGSEEEFQKPKQFLVTEKKFTALRGNEYILFAPNKTQVDILPFGSIEIDGSVVLKGKGLTSISVNGFMEVYTNGTEETETSTGHKFKVATLPAIVMLKFIAFDDRPDQRIKDAGDVGNILRNYFDLQTDLIYKEEYAVLFTEEIGSMVEVSSIVIGSEIKKIIQSNEQLHKRLITILQTHIQQKEDSMFVRQMGFHTIEEAIYLLSKMLLGLK
jgi:predicted nucleotidyltransferase